MALSVYRKNSEGILGSCTFCYNGKIKIKFTVKQKLIHSTVGRILKNQFSKKKILSNMERTSIFLTSYQQTINCLFSKNRIKLRKANIPFNEMPVKLLETSLKKFCAFGFLK